MNKGDILPAKLEDIDILINLMSEYYKEDGYKFTRETTRENLKEFINNPYLGIIFVLIFEKIICGYVVVTYGFSFEYGGRDAFVDELFVTLNYRGKGFGKLLLNKAINHSKTEKIKALHLEVEKYKISTREMYEKSGFILHNRNLMTLDLG